MSSQRKVVVTFLCHSSTPTKYNNTVFVFATPRKHTKKHTKYNTHMYTHSHRNLYMYNPPNYCPPAVVVIATSAGIAGVAGTGVAGAAAAAAA